MKVWLLIFILSAFFGALLGKFSRQFDTQTSELSSMYGDVVDTSVYACPSQDEYKTLLQKIKFQGDFPLDCQNPNTSKLARALKFLETAGVTPPPQWVGANDALKDPLNYVSLSARSVKLDPTQVTTIASNHNKGDILLGGRFLANDTLDSILTLLHESRHSNPLAAGHFTCRWGDITGTTGGCDQNFSNDDHAGAYAYQVLIGLAWAKFLPNLSQGQREFLLSTALYRLATRFNIIPNTMATPVEQIFVLDEKGAVYPVSPLTGKLLSRANAPTPFTRLGFYSGTNGFLAYTNNLSTYLYRPSGVLAGGFFKLKNLPPIPLRDVASLIHKSGNSAAAFQYFISAKNELKYFDFDPKTGNKFINTSAYQPSAFKLNLFRLANARRDRYALTDDAKVVYLEDDQVKIVPSTLNDPAGFQQIDGGLFCADLIGVTTKGEVKAWNDDTKSLDSLPFSGPVAKIQQSVSFTAALLEDNKIELRFWDGSQKIISINHPHKVVDMVVTRGYQMNQSVFGTTVLAPQLTEAVRACDIVKASPGIWSSEIVGINKSKQIVAYNPTTKECSKVDLTGFNIDNQNIDALELAGSVNGDNSQALSFPLITIRKTDGSVANFKPYKFK